MTFPIFIAALTILGVLAVVGSKFVLGRLYSAAVKRFPNEIILVLSVATAFVMLVVSDQFIMFIVYYPPPP